jgi:Uma2 family endonuclease
MSQPYEEIVNGESLLRSPPDTRHERVCELLHQTVGNSLAGLGTARLLSPRSVVRLSAGSLLRPDLSLVTAATGKLWLAAEIINAHDHRTDTVLKKGVYEDAHLPRLWMIDPRYDNVEIYHGSPYGLVLKKILAGSELLEEGLLPSFQVTIKHLFGNGGEESAKPHPPG